MNAPKEKGEEHFIEFVTVLREPISRFISSFFYLRNLHSRRQVPERRLQSDTSKQNGALLMRNITIWEYLNWTIESQLDNLQTRMLSGYSPISFYPEEKYRSINKMNHNEVLELAKRNLRRMTVVGLTERLSETREFFINALNLNPSAVKEIQR